MWESMHFAGWHHLCGLQAVLLYVFSFSCCACWHKSPTSWDWGCQTTSTISDLLWTVHFCVLVVVADIFASIKYAPQSAFGIDCDWIYGLCHRSPWVLHSKDLKNESVERCWECWSGSCVLYVAQPRYLKLRILSCLLGHKTGTVLCRRDILAVHAPLRQ